MTFVTTFMLTSLHRPMFQEQGLLILRLRLILPSLPQAPPQRLPSQRRRKRKPSPSPNSLPLKKCLTKNRTRFSFLVFSLCSLVLTSFRINEVLPFRSWFKSNDCIFVVLSTLTTAFICLSKGVHHLIMLQSSSSLFHIISLLNHNHLAPLCTLRSCRYVIMESICIAKVGAQV